MLKNKKVLTVLSLIVLLFTTCLTTCASANVDFTHNGTNYSFQDFPFDTKSGKVHWFFLRNNFGFIVAFCEDENFDKFVYTERGTIEGRKKDGTTYGGSNSLFMISEYDTVNDRWNSPKRWGDVSGGTVVGLLASEDIYKYDGTVFFYKPLTALAQILKEAKPKEVQLEIIKILPLILVVVVSLVGLRKGWKLLSTLLHRCLMLLILIVINLCLNGWLIFVKLC